LAVEKQINIFLPFGTSSARTALRLQRPWMAVSQKVKKCWSAFVGPKLYKSVLIW